MAERITIMNHPKLRTYTELQTLKTYDERVEYLRLQGNVGQDTFGFDRYMNQEFYKSAEWKKIRNQVIARDLGHDLGIEDREIMGNVIVHHMNPINKTDIQDSSDFLMNPEYLITVSLDTHNLIHYGIKHNNQNEFKERKPGDTCPWK